ncbi:MULTISPECIES: hypothetical protein [Bacillus]|nr:hypothetical protein [Bacillus wiedmannii]
MSQPKTINRAKCTEFLFGEVAAMLRDFIAIKLSLCKVNFRRDGFFF